MEEAKRSSALSVGRSRGRRADGSSTNGGAGAFFIPISRAGQTEAEAEKMKERFGKNTLTAKKQKGFFRHLLSGFNDPIIKILLASLAVNAAVSLGKINVPETLGIAAAILIATLVSTVSEYSSSLAFERLKEGSGAAFCYVKRGGDLVRLPHSQVAVGDIVILKAGMSVPADGLLVWGKVQCDQASLTGESRPREKKPYEATSVCPDEIKWSLQSGCQVFCSSTVCRGEGEMLVMRVGDSTFIGEVAGSLQNSGRPSPLKRRLSELARGVSYIGYVGAAMIAFAFLFNSFVIDSGMNTAVILEKLSDKGFVLSQILRALTVAVSVVVVAVPEGLPMMITVVLSSNMRKMLSCGVLVRRLVGIETAGNMNILFTDKTGTLTEGKMTVSGVYGVSWSASSLREMQNSPMQKEVTDCISLTCSESGGATEKALFAFLRGRGGGSALRKIPFDSEIKMSAGLGGGAKACFTGAPEKIIAACDRYIDKKGKVCAIDSVTRVSILERLTALCDSGCRVVCCAKGSAESFDAALRGEINRLTFICLAAMHDPVRKDVPQSVRDAHSAGIRVVMVTGDNPHTAAAVARECGIITDRASTVLEAETLHKMTDDEAKRALSCVAVVSRALPQDKIRLVRLAQEEGLVTGMTGDGINDAPALRASDVGFAMGSGTDIAKEAGDVVITDDSFSSITKAVLYGRTIFESIRKFIVFQLMMNLCAMGVSLIGPFIGIDSPVTVIQMLWVNIIMDTLGGLAFAGEPALRSYMMRCAVPVNEKLVSSRMMNRIFITGIYTLTLCIVFLKSGKLRAFIGGSDTYYLTVFFAMFIFCGIFNSFNVRTPGINLFSHLAGNKPFILIMTLVAAVQLLIIYFGGEVFRCEPLSARHLAIAALLAFSVIPADILRKIVFREK